MNAHKITQSMGCIWIPPPAIMGKSAKREAGVGGVAPVPSGEATGTRAAASAAPKRAPGREEEAKRWVSWKGKGQRRTRMDPVEAKDEERMPGSNIF